MEKIKEKKISEIQLISAWHFSKQVSTYKVAFRRSSFRFFSRRYIFEEDLLLTGDKLIADKKLSKLL